MSSDDIAYYRQRAGTERRRAMDAPSHEIASVHDKLAGLYEALTDRLERAQGVQDLGQAAHIEPPTPANRLQ